MSLDNDFIQRKRSEAQTLEVTFHVGKNGVTETTIAELAAQLKKRKLVKARLLPASTESGSDNRSQAEALAKGSESHLIEVRGNTAVFWKR